MARGTRLDGSSYSPWRTTATTTTLPLDPAPRQQTGPRLYGPEHRPQHPPVPQPVHLRPTHTCRRTTPTARHRRHADYGRSGIRGPARHRAPNKSVRPNGRRNDNQLNTTRPQGSGDPGHPLPGAEPYPAPQIRGRWAPSPNNPRHRTPAQGTGPEPHRKPATHNTTRRARARSTAGSQPSGSNKGPPGAPPTPWHT